jgi:uncharacterized RDD family membrane protein YckC
VSSWSRSPAPPRFPLPPGLALAGLRRRLAAWLIDGLILVGCQLAFWLVAAAVGAVSIDPAAEQQIQNSPLVMPTVAPYRANLPLLGVMLAVFVVLNVVYVAVAWARFRATPGQRVMSLEVASAATGGNLGLGRALVRAAVAVGVPVAAVAGLIYGVLAYETSVPWPDVMNPQPGGPAEAWLTMWSDLLYLAIATAATWPVLLLIWTSLSRTRQGLHDLLARSLVVAQLPWTGWAAPGYRPGYDPAFGVPPYGAPSDPGTWPSGVPGIPPDGAPGAWPPGAPGAWQPGDLPPDGVPGTWPPGYVPPATPSDGPAAEGEPAPGGWASRPLFRPLVGPGESDAPSKPVAATVGRRVSAYLFDCAFVFMVFGLTQSIAIALYFPSPTAVIDERSFILLGLVGGIEQLVYFTAGWVVWQGTLSQKLMHLRVADATTGKAMGWLDALVRWAVLQGPFALVTIAPEAVRFPLLLVAASWAAFLLSTTINGPELRGLHDRFLNSKVTQDQ